LYININYRDPRGQVYTWKKFKLFGGINMNKTKKILAAAVIGVVVLAGSIGVLANVNHSSVTTGTKHSGSNSVATARLTSELFQQGQAFVRMVAERPDGREVFSDSKGTQWISNPKVEIRKTFDLGVGVSVVKGTHKYYTDKEYIFYREYK
jgi:hypothetical protein